MHIVQSTRNDEKFHLHRRTNVFFVLLSAILLSCSGPLLSFHRHLKRNSDWKISHSILDV